MCTRNERKNKKEIKSKNCSFCAAKKPWMMFVLASAGLWSDFYMKDGEFERYKGKDAELIGLLNCGDCPGATIVTRLAQVSLSEQTHG